MSALIGAFFGALIVGGAVAILLLAAARQRQYNDGDGAAHYQGAKESSDQGTHVQPPCFAEL